MSLDEEAGAALAELAAAGRLRGRRVLSGAQGVRVVVDGRAVVSFSSNDYLGLAAHPAVVAAARVALDRAGVGAGASRLIVGNTEDHERLEASLAAWLGRPALLFGSGYAANTGVLPALCGPGDTIFSDQLNHASIIDGCRLSRAAVVVYPHRDVAALARALGEHGGRRKLVVTESVFSMDGDVADLAAIDRARRAHGAALVVDEAHALGAMGEGGRGVAAGAGVVPDVLVGTLGKSLGAAGAFVVAGRATVDLLWNRARSLVFSTALPAVVAAAAAAAVEIVRGEEGAVRRARLAENIAAMRPARSSTAIQSVRIDDDLRVMAVTDALLESGLYVQGIRPPTVPVGTARLRVALSADHSPSDLELLNNALRRFT